MEDNSAALTQNEINHILGDVRKDNIKNESIRTDPEISLSQAELDRLFSKKSSDSPAASSISAADEIRAAKIAARKAHAAAILAQANAGSPRRVTVIYGAANLSAGSAALLKEGDSLSLDRVSGADASIYVDGRLFAYGKLEDSDGHASVRITKLSGSSQTV